MGYSRIETPCNRCSGTGMVWGTIESVRESVIAWFDGVIADGRAEKNGLTYRDAIKKWHHEKAMFYANDEQVICPHCLGSRVFVQEHWSPELQ